MEQQNQNTNASAQIPPQKKQFKSFWPIVIIASLSALIGGLIVWAAFNSGLEDQLNSLLPGSQRAMKEHNVKLQQEQKTKMMEEQAGTK